MSAEAVTERLDLLLLSLRAVRSALDFMQRETLFIGGIKWTIVSNDVEWSFHPKSPYPLFRVENFFDAGVEIELEVKRRPPLGPPPESVVLTYKDPDSMFDVHKNGDLLYYRFFLPSHSGLTARSAEICFLGEGRAKCAVDLHPRVYGSKCFYPLEYPLDEVVYSVVGSLYGVFAAHALGVINGSGEGVLFMGHSGDGKSTQARVLSALGDYKILSDDRVGIRLEGEKFNIYGTPWHGDAEFSYMGQALLKKIFILEKGPKEDVAPLSKTEAASEVLSRLFLSAYLKESLEAAVEFVEKLVECVPVARLTLPNRGSVLRWLG